MPEIFYSAGTEVETEIEWSSEQPDGSSFHLLQLIARWLRCPWAISGITEVILRLISCQCENNGVFLMQRSSYFNARDPKRGGKAPSALERQVLNWNLIRLVVCVERCTSYWLNNRISEPSYR